MTNQSGVRFYSEEPECLFLCVLKPSLLQSSSLRKMLWEEAAAAWGSIKPDSLCMTYFAIVAGARLLTFKRHERQLISLSSLGCLNHTYPLSEAADRLWSDHRHTNHSTYLRTTRLLVARAPFSKPFIVDSKGSGGTLQAHALPEFHFTLITPVVPSSMAFCPLLFSATRSDIQPLHTENFPKPDPLKPILYTFCCSFKSSSRVCETLLFD